MDEVLTTMSLANMDAWIYFEDLEISQNGVSIMKSLVSGLWASPEREKRGGEYSSGQYLVKLDLVLQILACWRGSRLQGLTMERMLGRNLRIWLSKLRSFKLAGAGIWRSGSMSQWEDSCLGSCDGVMESGLWLGDEVSVTRLSRECLMRLQWLVYSGSWFALA